MKGERSMVGEGLHRFHRAIIICCLLLFTHVLWGQKVSTILSKDKIVIGEQITLKISVEGVTTNQVQQDFVFPDTINHLEILSDSIDSDGPNIIHTLTITSFDSGYWQFPAFELTLAGNRKLTSQPVNITVLPADISNMADYHDIRDILEVKAENNWWIIAAIVLVGLISLFVFLWFVTNKTQQQQAVLTTTDLGKLYEKLLKRLSFLETTDTTERTGAFNLYNETSQSIRSFIDAAYRQQTMHLTSGEYILKMKGKLPEPETESNYFQFLRLADAVKFAKYLPPADETKVIFPVLRKVAEEVYHQNKLQKG